MAQHYKEYLVIKILSKISNKHNKCECIPSCWIRTADEESNIVVFGYPLLGDNLNAPLSVLNYEPLDYEWPQLYGEVLFDANYLDEAFRFLEKKKLEMKNITRNTNQTNHTNEKVKEITALKQISINLIKLPSNETNNHPSQQKKSDQENIIQSTTSCNDLEKKVDLEISAAHDSIRRYTKDLCNDIEFFSASHNSHDTEMPDATNEIDVEAMKKAPVNNEFAKKIVERPRRKSISKKSYCEISDDEYDDFVVVDASSNTETANSDSYIGISTSPRESIAVGVNNFLEHEDITMNLFDNPVHAYLYNFYVDINDSYQKTMSRFDSAADYVHKIITAHKEKLEAKTNQSSSDKHMETMNSISDPPSLLQESVSLSHIGDKWTLRYPKPGYGIIELLPNTGVYVSQEGLNNCKLMSMRTTELTRHLLKEVFTDEALKMCTPSGKRRFKLGLNSRARETLIDYVLKYSSEKRWEGNLVTVTACIQNVLTRSRQ